MPFDCELIGEGLLAQPVNTLSSLAFLIAAVVVGRRRQVAGAVLALVATGSVLFHGFPSSTSTTIHDIGLLLLVGLIGWSLWQQRRRLPGGAMAILAIGMVVWFVSRTDGVWCSPAASVQGHAIWHLLAALASALILIGRQAD